MNTLKYHKIDITSAEIGDDIPKMHMHSFHVVHDENEKIASAALYKNDHLKEYAFSIGAYTCTDDLNASNLLFEKICNEAIEQQAKWIIGPMNGSTWESYRYAEINEIPFFLMEPQQPAHYIDQWLSNGFESWMDYFSCKSSLKNKIDFGEEKLKSHFESLDINLKILEGNELLKRLPELAKFNNTAFKENALFSPLPEDIFIKKYAMVLHYVKGHRVLIAEDQGQIVGFGFAYPHGDTLIIKTLARHPDKKYRGLGVWMTSVGFNWARDNGFDFLIHALMKADNDSIRISEVLQGDIFRHYYLYRKKLN